MEKNSSINYNDRSSGSLIDRMMVEPELEQVDVIMETLDAVNLLEKGLYSVYREIPVRKLIVCDGGSKDGTIEILKKFPRVQLHVRPDIKTSGKTVDFLLSLVETEWFVFIDGEIELSPGWYDEMCKHKSSYDVLENSRRIDAYHFYRERKDKLEPDSRPLNFCHLIRKSAVQNFHCDDDYIWRAIDIFFRQVVENSGNKYGKISTTSHLHHDTERVQYDSDKEKKFGKFVYTKPKYVIIDEKKFKLMLDKAAKEAVKYLDPDTVITRKAKWFDGLVSRLDRKWVKKNGPKWLKRYDHGSSKVFAIKKLIYKNFLASGKAKKILRK